MEDPTIEFCAISDDTDPHVRQFFRVPVKDEHGVSIFISDAGYRVSEISQTGVGLLVEDNQTFEVGVRLDACRLQFDDTGLTGLTGKIVHCSSHEDLWKYGIQWIEITDTQKQKMDELLSRLKKFVMASPQLSVPDNAGREK